MAYHAELNGRSTGQPQATQEAAILAYANGSNHQVIRQGFLTEVVLIDDKGRYHSKAQIREIQPAVSAAHPAMTRKQLEREHDAIHNDGGEGYNPYRRGY
jgi:hypothetical protein